MSTWFDIVQFALPSGFLGFGCSWFLNRRAAKAHQLESVEFAYKNLYLSLKSEVAAINKELMLVKAQLRNASNCPHYNDGCPIHNNVNN